MSSPQPKPLDVTQSKSIAKCESLPEPARSKCYEPHIAQMNAAERGPITGWIYISIIMLIGFGGLLAAILAIRNKK